MVTCKRSSSFGSASPLSSQRLRVGVASPLGLRQREQAAAYAKRFSTAACERGIPFAWRCVSDLRAVAEHFVCRNGQFEFEARNSGRRL